MICGCGCGCLRIAWDCVGVPSTACGLLVAQHPAGLVGIEPRPLARCRTDAAAMLRGGCGQVPRRVVAVWCRWEAKQKAKKRVSGFDGGKGRDCLLSPFRGCRQVVCRPSPSIAMFAGSFACSVGRLCVRQEFEFGRLSRASWFGGAVEHASLFA